MKTKSLVITCRFLFRNFWCTRRLRPFSVARLGVYVIGPLDAVHRKAAIAQFLQLNPGGGLSFPQRLLLWLHRSCRYLLAHDIGEGARGEFVAGTPFYLNAWNRRENTAHAPYNDLRPTAQSAGNGTITLRDAAAYFATFGLVSASSRFTLSNRVALKDNEQAGVPPRVTYFDSAMEMERRYLDCDFQASAGSSRRCHQGDN